MTSTWKSTKITVQQGTRGGPIASQLSSAETKKRYEQIKLKMVSQTLKSLVTYQRVLTVGIDDQVKKVCHFSC
jgi:hypothetical protein